MPLRRRFRLLVVCLCVLSFAMHQAHAAGPALQPYDPHHVDGRTLGGSIDLSETWLVYGGDDPRYADPAFDDSQWPVASLSQRLNRYGIHDQPIVWYRLHVEVPASANDLDLNFYEFRGSMEAYVNGVRIGGFGTMSGGGEWRQDSYYHLMPIPNSALNGGNLVIAVRAAIGQFTRGETYTGGVSKASLGPSDVLHDQATLTLFEDLSSNGYRLVLEAITIFVLVALVFALPRQHEYLALALSFLFAAANNIVQILGSISFQSLPSVPIQLIVQDLLGLGTVLIFLEFFNLALIKRWTRWIRLIQASVVVSIWLEFSWTIATVSGLLFPTPALNASLSLLRLLTWAPYILLLPGILLWERRKSHNHDAGILLVPVLLITSIDAYVFTGDMLVHFHVIHSFAMLVPVRSLRVRWGEVSDVTANLALLVYIILRVVRTVRKGARYASEVEAAQTVQQVLLARSQQPTPGFKVDTVYLPASEVGGDFFLVSPSNDESGGSLLAIVGDVAGKGMLAAMRVSVILGILRREDSREPGTILSRLNDAMMRQGNMGLTTACCVRIERDGRYTVANAGHISPYAGGGEILTAGALPLGIVAEQRYEQCEGILKDGDSFVLMSDGVVEAQSPAKELYGFERLAELTRLPANEIAQTAKLFGQQDDITVMTLRCVA